MSQDAPAPNHESQTAEAKALAAVLLALLVLASLGLSRTERAAGWLRWEYLDANQALLLLNQNLTGPGCLTLLPQSQVTLDGQYAQVTVPGLGRFEVQAHHVGIYTVHALTPIADLDSCRFNPRYVGLVL